MKYQKRLGCTTEIVSHVLDWQEDKAMLCEALCTLIINEAHGSPRRHQLPREVGRIGKRKRV